MREYKTCPDCGSNYSGRSCTCGWTPGKKTEDHNCSWTSFGDRCERKGSVKSGGRWYCSYHNYCLETENPISPKEWYAQYKDTKVYDKDAYAKGMVLWKKLGLDSLLKMSWKHASEYDRAKAKELFENCYTPKILEK